MPKKSKAPAPPEKRGRGRPPAANPATTTFQMRATPAQRAVWRGSAEASGQAESEWARDAFDGWVLLCQHAAELGTNPREFLGEAIESRARVRAAVAELTAARTLSNTEARLFRVLAPVEWARNRAE